MQFPCVAGPTGQRVWTSCRSLDVEMTLYMMYLDQRVGPHWFDPFDPFDPLRGSGHMSVK